MTEQWRDLPGFEGKYQVSDLGRVISTNYRFTGEAKLMATYVDGRYVRVTLHKDKKHMKSLVHLLVMLAFVGPKPRGLQVNHKDGDRRNNSLGNLEYVTQSENMAHAERLGLRTAKKGEQHGGAKLTEDSVRQIRYLRAEENLTYAELGRRFGITLQQARNVVRGIHWQSVDPCPTRDTALAQLYANGVGQSPTYHPRHSTPHALGEVTP